MHMAYGREIYDDTIIACFIHYSTLLEVREIILAPVILSTHQNSQRHQIQRDLAKICMHCLLRFNRMSLKKIIY